MKKIIRQQWVEALHLLSGAFQSGLNFEGAFDVLVRESPAPLKFQLEKRWGPTHDWMAIPQLIDHLFCDPGLELVRAGLRLAYETGSGASGLLSRCAELLREKAEFEEKVRVLTAHGRVRAWVVGGSPLLLLGSLSLLSPDLVRPLFLTSLGRLLLGGVLLLLIVGLWLVHRMARVEL